VDKTDRDIGEFLGSLPDEARDDMVALDREISRVMAGLPRVLYTGKMWGGTDQEIIGYGTYRYTRADKKEVEWFAVGLALQKNYLSVYVNAVEGRQYVAEKYGEDLGKVKVGKSSISFGSLDDIDLGKLVALLERARAIVEQGE
jgi:hypothetical protein